MSSERSDVKLRAASWLRTRSVQKVFSIFAGAGAEVRVVGGAVRNAILNEPVSDVDFATTATPTEVLKIAKSSKVRAEPLGIEHGTILLLIGRERFEVTTLREDVKTFGRSAEVEFGTDWLKDAQRRDFTINALYADRKGNVYDYVGGVEDCRNRNLRFIGNAEQRIREDYLRILRYFRFLSKYSEQLPDDGTMSAIVNNMEGLKQLSRERVRIELLKLLETSNASKVVKCMDENGLLEILLDRKADLDRFNSLIELTTDPLLRLFALTVGAVGDVDRIVGRLALSKKEGMRLRMAHAAAESYKSDFTDLDVCLFLYRNGREAALDGATIAWRRECPTASSDEWRTELKRLKSTEIPEFPVSGQDLLSAGLEPGKIIGLKLKTGKEIWMKSGFSLNRDEILQHLVT